MRESFVGSIRLCTGTRARVRLGLRDGMKRMLPGTLGEGAINVLYAPVLCMYMGFVATTNSFFSLPG